MTRDDLGKAVRDGWVKWAKTQPDPKSSWLVPWEDLNETDREADRCIGDGLVAYLSAVAPVEAGQPSPMLTGRVAELEAERDEILAMLVDGTKDDKRTAQQCVVEAIEAHGSASRGRTA